MLLDGIFQIAVGGAHQPDVDPPGDLENDSPAGIPALLRALADEDGDYFKYTSYDTFLVVSALTVGLAQITPLQYRTSQPE